MIALAIALIVLAVTATTALATSTRAEYVAQVEPICKAAQKPSVKAYAQFFGELKRAGVTSSNFKASKRGRRIYASALARFYGQLTGIYGRATSGIATVPATPADQTTVSAWLEKRNQATALSVQASRAARHQKFTRANRIADRAVATSKQAAALVSGFHFTFCSWALGQASSD